MFTYDFGLDTWKELRYVLFSKKPCPRCGRKLRRVDVVPEHSNGWQRSGLDFKFNYTVREGYRYRCDPCHAHFSLAELVADR